MGKAFPAQLAAIGNKVLTVAIPEDCKRTVAWCVEQLPALYAKLLQTNESRYAEEIARLVQGLLNQLATPEAQKPAARITQQLRHLHEQFGLPRLNLRPLGASSLRSRKAVAQ